MPDTEGVLQAVRLGCLRGEAHLFRHLSFTVAPGEWVQIAGRNGVGKTTLLRMLTGIIQPDRGEVRWQAQPLHRVREAYHRSLLWLGHQPGIHSALTARQNLRFYHPTATPAAYDEALAQVGLAGRDSRPVCQLSAGQQRRVALARLWLTQARVWILDEPFTALDGEGIAALTHKMADHVAARGLIVMTSHQQSDRPAGQGRVITLAHEERG